MTWQYKDDALPSQLRVTVIRTPPRPIQFALGIPWGATADTASVQAMLHTMQRHTTVTS